MPDPQINIGNMNIHGGQQNIGGHNTNIQHNTYAAPADQVRDLLTAIRTEHPDPAYAGREVEAIEGDLQEGTPQARSRIQTRLQALARSATDTRTVAEAAAAIGAIVATQWPF
ncbi:hypothetical protein Ade02nite_28640 [Paractinoplanes deccanensis]|uniref:Uncharacterized protein n=1 Tax=Paractinoplanes deccanensis TaxID=113561 RepID=A0ABQ3Y2M7_9ACTN|nr:hypothetical protein [Actinoplanes deccanensis]GID74223.1 hypothetical protein Ade02nite_28640 [Actinoplanes deccanensis]